MLREDIESKMRSALKAGEVLKLSVYRMLLAAIHNREIEARSRAGKGVSLSGEEIEAVIRSELKKRRDAIEAYRRGNRPEAAEREESEAGILEEFLPAEFSDEELGRIVEEVLASLSPDGRNFGKVMGLVMSAVKGRASGQRAQDIVKKKLG